MRRYLPLVVVFAAVFSIGSEPDRNSGSCAPFRGGQITVRFSNRGQDYIFLRGVGGVDAGTTVEMAKLYSGQEPSFEVRRDGVDLGVLKLRAMQREDEDFWATVTMTEPSPNELVFTSSESVLRVTYSRP